VMLVVVWLVLGTGRDEGPVGRWAWGVGTGRAVVAHGWLVCCVCGVFLVRVWSGLRSGFSVST